MPDLNLPTDVGAGANFENLFRREDGTFDLDKAKEWDLQIEQARLAAAHKLKIYSNGIVHCSVCAAKELTREELVRLVNQLNPTGVSSAWEISSRPFASGAPNPSPCNDSPDRLHWLMDC